MINLYIYNFALAVCLSVCVSVCLCIRYGIENVKSKRKSVIQRWFPVIPRLSWSTLKFHFNDNYLIKTVLIERIVLVLHVNDVMYIFF